MRVLLLASLLALTMGQRTSSEHKFYHEAVGIQAAAKIKTAEEATDFSGSRIVGGLPAPLGAHPYLAGLIITLTTGQTSVCGGALLSNTRVVTAAHCYFDGFSLAQVIQVVLGSTSLFSGGTRLTSNSVLMHPAWDWSWGQNNVAVITTPYVAYTPFIRNINLPTGGLLSNDFAGMWVQASGYGVTTPGGQGSTKQHVWQEVITNAVCDGEFPMIFPSELCTDHSRNQGPCYGDEGGPLVGVTGGQHVLIGMGSFFPPSGCVTLPGRYTRVTSFAFWIEAQIPIEEPDSEEEWITTTHFLLEN